MDVLVMKGTHTSQAGVSSWVVFVILDHASVNIEGCAV